MMRRALPSNAVAVLVAMTIAGCGGGDDGDNGATTPPPPTENPSDGGTATPAPSQLPPAFVQCMAEQGYDVASSDDIHAAPPDVLQGCFGALHQAGG